PCRARLAIVRENRILARAGPPVVQERGHEPQPPERRRAQLAARSLSLDDPIAERSHVVEEEVRVGLEAAVVERCHWACAGRERAHVAARAPELREEAAPRIPGPGGPEPGRGGRRAGAPE